MDMKFGLLNVCIGRAVLRDLSKYNLDLVGVQEVRWEDSGTKPVGEYTFFCGKGNKERKYLKEN
jgi:hypothetical protein